MNDFLLHDEFETDIDLTPLIDVIFMLLLFFILASTFSAPVLRVALPKAVTASPADSAHDRLILAVNRDGIFIGATKPLRWTNCPVCWPRIRKDRWNCGWTAPRRFTDS
jgi:biopolymer transport protein ExbD